MLEWTAGGEPDLVVSDRRYRHADGHTVFARCTIRMERDADGRLVGQFVHVADLTRLRQAEDALATSEARFRRAFDEAPIGMALGSEDSRLLWVNDAFCALLGRPWAEVVGRLATDFVHSDDLEEAAEIVASGHVRREPRRAARHPPHAPRRRRSCGARSRSPASPATAPTPRPTRSCSPRSSTSAPPTRPRPAWPTRPPTTP